LTARKLIQVLEANGWKQVRQKGSHRQFKHSENPKIVTVPDHPGVDLKPGTLNSILKLAGLKN
jgi:predicted RNA binding protein YcfA (HicA-like mRNA interferase family)